MPLFTELYMPTKPIPHSLIKFEDAPRYSPSVSEGLTAAQIKERQRNGYTNFNATVKTKSVSKIILTNTLSVFNFVNIIIAAALLYVGSYKNTTFMLVILCNIAIGVFQELRAKKAVEKLSFVSQAKATVLRSGKTEEIPVDEVLLDDIVILKSGSQLFADCVILQGECEVNESFVTGEAESVFKHIGDTLLSGSFIASGECIARADKIADRTYISSISRSAKTIRETQSVLMKSLKRIITVIAVAIFPIGALLFMNQYQICGELKEAVEHTSAALIGMIPQGLMLLTSTALAVSVIRLSVRKVLVKDLYGIEMLARVDTVCLDKTGTLTEGSLYVEDTVSFDGSDVQPLLSDLAAALGSDNATMQAICERYGSGAHRDAVRKVAFSSKTKWSGIVMPDGSSIILGACEYILPGNEEILRKARGYSEMYRVLLIAKSPEPVEFGRLPQNIIPVGFVLLSDKIRPEAKTLIKYLNLQDVDVKIISGDNPVTVSAIARRVGVRGWEKYIDCSTLRTDSDVRNAALKYTVFGRVTPFQKKQLVLALKRKNRTVAMTGDGVNDVLAMKEADCSVAMGGGTDAARNVAKIVLVNSSFDSLPSIIGEGRRCVNNIQQSASFFLSKTIYSSLLAVLLLVLHRSYPFQPIQQSYISLFGIGIPSFILALQPNRNRISRSFFENVFRKALPTGLCVTICTLLISYLGEALGYSNKEITTVNVVVTGLISIWLLMWVCAPFNRRNFLLFSGISLMYTAGFTLTLARNIMDMPALSPAATLFMIGQMITATLVMLVLIEIFPKLFDFKRKKHEKSR